MEPHKCYPSLSEIFHHFFHSLCFLSATGNPNTIGAFGKRKANSTMLYDYTAKLSFYI